MVDAVSIALNLPYQFDIVRLAIHGQKEFITGSALKRMSLPHDNRAVTRATKPIDKVRADAALVDHDDPGRWLVDRSVLVPRLDASKPPHRSVEPLLVMCIALARDWRRRLFALGVDPESLALVRVCWQGDAPTLSVSVIAGPIDLRTRKPQMCHAPMQHPRIVAARLRIAHHLHDRGRSAI